MMDSDLLIKTDEENSTHTKLPILAQLGVLAFILIGIFGTLFFGYVTGQTTNVATTEYQIEELPDTRIVPLKIENVSLLAKAAYVWDVREQRALYTKDASEALPLASITKLMTALLAHELISNNTKTSISSRAISQDGDYGLLVGETFTAQELLQLTLISSSNDAAFELSASVGALLGDRDPNAQFVRGMNLRAEELGLSTLSFENPTGLDTSRYEAGAVGSAKDVSFLMEYILTNYPEILEPTRKQAARVYNEEGAFHDIENTNEIIYKIPNLIGSKTGYTDLAGGNLTIAFDAGLNHPIIVTVLGSTKDGRFKDVLTLVEEVKESITTNQ